MDPKGLKNIIFFFIFLTHGGRHLDENKVQKGETTQKGSYGVHFWAVLGASEGRHLYSLSGPDPMKFGPFLTELRSKTRLN